MNKNLFFLLFPDFRSDEHDVLVTVVQDDHKWAGMCALLNDGVVEYFVEELQVEADPCQVRALNHLGFESRGTY